MIRDGKENDLSSCFGNPFRRSLLSVENDFKNHFFRKDESEVITTVKKETVKKEKIIIIEGQIVS